MKQPKRILIVLNDTGRGGAETQALYLSKGLIENKFEVHVLSFGSKKGSYWEEFKEAGVQIHLTGFNPKVVLPPFANWKAFFIYINYMVRLIKLIRSISPTVIFPFTYFPDIILSRCWRYTGAKALYWNQRDASLMFKGKLWEIKGLNACTGIISNSHEGMLFLQNYTNQPIKIIHNGVIIPQNHKVESVKSKIRIVMIANLHDLKDHLTLLKAWKIIIKENNVEEVELLLAGRDGNKASEIRQFINDNNLENSVNCLGEVSDVPTLLATCDIGVLSSLKEGLPNGILECMAMGLPVVATNMYGAIETLGEDYTFLANPSDENDLAQMILQLINDVDLRKKIGSQNIERIRKNFDVNNMIEDYISLI